MPETGIKGLDATIRVVDSLKDGNVENFAKQLLEKIVNDAFDRAGDEERNKVERKTENNALQLVRPGQTLWNSWGYNSPVAEDLQALLGRYMNSNQNSFDGLQALELRDSGICSPYFADESFELDAADRATSTPGPAAESNPITAHLLHLLNASHTRENTHPSQTKKLAVNDGDEEITPMGDDALFAYIDRVINESMKLPSEMLPIYSRSGYVADRDVRAACMRGPARRSARRFHKGMPVMIRRFFRLNSVRRLTSKFREEDAVKAFYAGTDTEFADALDYWLIIIAGYFTDIESSWLKNLTGLLAQFRP